MKMPMTTRKRLSRHPRNALLLPKPRRRCVIEFLPQAVLIDIDAKFIPPFRLRQTKKPMTTTKRRRRNRLQRRELLPRPRRRYLVDCDIAFDIA